MMDKDEANAMLLRGIADKNSFLVSSALHQGADPNHDSSLVAAVDSGSETIVKLLLRAGADPKKVVVDEKNPKETLLHRAARSGTIGILQAIHEYFTDINAPDKNGNAPLHLALNDSNKVQYLIGAGANLNAANSDGDTPLHLVTDEVSLDLLLKAGADATIPNNEGRLPIHNHKRSADHIKCFKGNGADIHAQDKKGNTILHLIANSNLSLFRDAVKYAINGDKPNEDGKTALQIYYDTFPNVHDIYDILQYGYDFTQITPSLMSNEPARTIDLRRSISKKLDEKYCALLNEISTFTDSVFKEDQTLIKDNKPTAKLLSIAGIGLLPELFDHPFLKNNPEKKLEFYRRLEGIFPEHCKEILHRQVDITKEQRLEIPDAPGNAVKMVLTRRGENHKGGVGGPS